MKKRIVSKQDMDAFSITKLNRFVIGYYTQKDPKRNGVNEDSLGFVVDNDKAVLMVADGVGGAPKGDEASQTTVDKVLEQAGKYFWFFRKIPKLRPRIIQGLEDANQKLLTDNKGASTTATICSVDHEALRVYQVGDSSMLLCGQRGLLKYRATEHSPVGYAMKAGFLDEEAAMEHPERHLVSNLVGERDMNIELGPTVPFAQYDTILLASDGLLDNFYTDDLVDVIRKDSMEGVMTQLTRMVAPMREKENEEQFRKFDDVSFIVCRQLN